MDDNRIGQIGYSWRERGGSHMTYIGRGVTEAEAEEAARKWGWPGHNGAWWRYALDDLKTLIWRTTP